MGQKRSVRNSADRITGLSGLVRALDLYVNKTDEASDADKDRPLSVVAFKELVDAALEAIIYAEGYTTSDMVILSGVTFDINGSSYEVLTSGYAFYQGEIVKINTGTATDGGAGVTFSLSSTEDGPFKTYDIAAGGSSPQVDDRGVWSEEGTWEPDVSDSDVGGNLASVTLGNCYYKKSGRMVHVNGEIENIDTTGMTLANVIVIQNLPFAKRAASHSVYHHGCISIRGKSANTDRNLLVQLQNGGTSFRVLEMYNNVNLYNNVDLQDLSANSDISFDLYYPTEK